MTYEMRAVCKCGWNTRAPCGDIIFVDEDCCPNCGSLPSSWEMKSVFIPTWVSDTKWYNPFSWRDGYFTQAPQKDANAS